MMRRVAEQIRALSVREAIQGVMRGYREHELLTFASAIAFQVLFALIPLALFGLGLLGGLGLQDEWTQDWGPRVRGSVSPAVFEVIDETVRRVLGQRQVFWMTAGGAIAIWKVSAATRGIMDVFDRIYGSRRERSAIERMRVSLELGVGVGVLVLLAAACVLLGDDAVRAIGIESPLVLLLRWLLALAVLFAALALLVARAPADPRPLQWVTFGSIIVVGSWIATSVAYGWYLTSVAEYASVFGALATVVVTLTYLYLASAAVLTGAQLDALVVARAERGSGVGAQKR